MIFFFYTRSPRSLNEYRLSPDVKSIVPNNVFWSETGEINVVVSFVASKKKNKVTEQGVPQLRDRTVGITAID